MSKYKLAFVLLFSLAVCGCASMPAPTYQPSIANSEKLMQGKGKFAVGEFSAAQGVNNKSLGVRATVMNGGEDGTFSTYLRQALVRELETAGRFDTSSVVSISGTLTQNKLAGGVGTGSAVVGARFVVTRNQATVYDKKFEATHEWDSSFMAALAVPAAMQNWSVTVQKLLADLVNDPDFADLALSP